MTNSARLSKILGALAGSIAVIKIDTPNLRFLAGAEAALADGNKLFEEMLKPTAESKRIRELESLLEDIADKLRDDVDAEQESDGTWKPNREGSICSRIDEALGVSA